MNMLAQMRLLQIASQAIPIGGYSHSHGLEAAIESGLVHDEASVQQWITDMLSFSIGSFEAEAPRTTFFVVPLAGAGLGAAFYLGNQP